MKRGLKIVISWLCLFSLFASPLTAFGAGTTSSDPIWPEPGAIQLSKTEALGDLLGEWKITLKVEGKNLRTSSDVVLVIDKSDSMNERKDKESPTKLEKAKEAANKFAENLLQQDAETRIAVVSFNKEADLVAGFKGPNNKDEVYNAINGIKVNAGTNIQAGLVMAKDLLSQSIAKNKLIILLSDGDPTFSYKGTSATSYKWSENSYNFAINAFDYGKRLGDGGDFSFKKKEAYKINKYRISDHGIGTISEAKIIKDKGIKIYSVGLDVSKDSKANKVLKDIQNEGYYSGSSEDLLKIFRELSGKISFAAQDAKVIDPMGDMFNLKLKGATISPEDYTVSQGSVTWDPSTEKFTWNVGNIAEGDPAIFTYTVIMDQSKNPVSDILYPTNGTTTIEYTDVNNRNVTKEFDVPKVSIGKGSILVKGYKVNADGNPVNAEGVEVQGPEFAEQLYSYTFKDEGGKEALQIGSAYSVAAEEHAGYQHLVGISPANIQLTVTAPTPTVWFGYLKTENQTVTVKYLDKESGKELKEQTEEIGQPGSKVELKAEKFDGYTILGQDKVEYTFTLETNQVHIFYYTANEQDITVKYVDRATGDKLAEPSNVPGVTGKKVTLEAVEVTGYTPENETFQYMVQPEGNEYIFYYKANEPDNNRTLTVRYVDLITGNDLLDPTEHSGKVGEEITLTANDYTDSVTGAVYKPHDYSVPYTFKNEPLHDVFTFTYTQDVSSLERTVLVHHVDRESNLPLTEPTPASGKAGETIILKAGPISVADAVYMPEEFSYNYTVTLDLEQEFTIYYNLGEPSGDVVKLTISYLDRETNGEIASQEVIEGKAGTQFTLNAKNVPGYTPEIPSFEYRYSDEPNQNYVFYYTKNAPTDQQLTVKYLLNGTNEQLASPSVFTGKPGETKTLTAVSISGYTPVKSTDAYTFTTQAGQEYIFYYTRNSSNPGGSGGSNTSSGSTVTPLPALPPLPAVPPTLEMENHYDYINGYPDGSVKPLNNITREEVAAIFYRLLDDESRSEYLKTGNSFSDVGATRWSNKHISTMENAGVITGYPDGTFKPGQYITRAEFAAIASRFDKLDERANDSFTDITGHWAEKYIASAANKGWIKGYTDGTFKPNQYITRAEAAAFINSVLNRKVDKDGIHEDAKMWPDNVYGKWYYYDILEATNHHDYSREEEAEVEVWEEVLPNRVYP